MLVAVALGGYARHWARLAGRSRVGARSEDQVQRALAPLQAEGWRLRHSLGWQGRRDIDSVAIAPTRIGFAIEAKTKRFEAQHLARVIEMAAWLRSRRRRWCRKGALPVLCVVHATRLQRVEAGVLIVSLDRLLAALRTAARTRERPAFLSPVPYGSYLALGSQELSVSTERGCPSASFNNAQANRTFDVKERRGNHDRRQTSERRPFARDR